MAGLGDVLEDLLRPVFLRTELGVQGGRLASDVLSGIEVALAEQGAGLLYLGVGQLLRRAVANSGRVVRRDAQAAAHGVEAVTVRGSQGLFEGGEPADQLAAA